MKLNEKKSKYWENDSDTIDMKCLIKKNSIRMNINKILILISTNFSHSDRNQSLNIKHDSTGFNL